MQRWPSQPYPELLGDIDLAGLIKFPFSSDAAELERTAISLYAHRIDDEAIARQLGKDADENTQQDRETVRELNLAKSDLDDARPLAGLVGLRNLGLWNTQVGDVSPLSGLARLKDLDLTDTTVSDV